MSTETASDPRVGTVLDGNYRITRVIGSGGMSTVYEATQLRLGKRMAIKILAADMTANERVMARFHREAKITSKLGHPNLISVVDRGRTETGEPFLVMEYLEGEDLDERLARVGHLPVPDVVNVVMQTAAGLSAAHAQGIVHRDLKPANIFLMPEAGEPDFIKVLDFGVSKLITAHTRLTKQAVAVGTPFYMAPEQAAGMVDSVDHRVDQWALACIAWEMLLGERPFVATTPMEVMQQIVATEPAALTSRVPGLPLAVEPVLRKALRKRATDRYDSIRQFAHAFASAALGEPVEPAPSLRNESAPGAAGSAGGPLAARLPEPSAAAPMASALGPRRGRFNPTVLVASAASAVLVLVAAIWWLQPRGGAQGPKPAHQPVISPVVDAQAPSAPVSPDSREVEPVAEPAPVRVKRAKAAKKRSQLLPRPHVRRPLFDKL